MKTKFFAPIFFIFYLIEPSFAQESSLSQVYRDGDLLSVRVGKNMLTFETAVSNAAKQKGLSKRIVIPQDGMIFLFEKKQRLSFWMRDMLFPIDIVWIGEGKVLSFHENVPPEPGISLSELTRYYSPPNTDTVLELKAGDVLKLNIKKGDKFTIREKLEGENDK